MSEIKKYKKYLNFKANPRYLRRDFIVPLYTGTEPDIVPEASVEELGTVQEFNEGGSVERQSFKFGSGEIRSSNIMNKIADVFLKAYAEDDVSYLTSKSKFNKKGMFSKDQTNDFNRLMRHPKFIQDIVDKTNLKSEDILDLIDERENFHDLEVKTSIASQTQNKFVNEARKKIDQGEDWLVKNSKNYDTVKDLKKGFKRVFGKNHPFLKNQFSTTYGMPKLNSLFFENKKSYIATKGGNPAFTYTPSEMKNLFQASLYNFNPVIRDKVLNELNDVLPKTKITETQKFDLRKKFKNNKILSDLGINERLTGPVTRLLIKDLGENIIEDINFIRYPRVQVGAYINFLKDKVNPKYKKQFELVNKALTQLHNKNYDNLKKTLNIVENINFDHKVPKFLIDAGYADEIEYIKLNPIGENFNQMIKNKNFDSPIARLIKKYEATNISEEKVKIIEKMNEIKNNFNKRYNNYLSDIDIKEIDGKLNVSSSLKPITSANEFIKTLETNVKQNPELFKILNKIENVKTKSAIDIADELSKEDARAVCGKLNLGGLPKGCAELAKENPDKFLKTVAETSTDTKFASKATQALNFTKGAGKAAEEIIGFGRGVVGRTLGPLAALNSALEQWTAGNTAEGFRKIGDLVDLTTLVGDPFGFEKSRREGTEADIKKVIGEKNYGGFENIKAASDEYVQLLDVTKKLERAEQASQNQFDPDAPGVDQNYIDQLKTQKSILEKNIEGTKYGDVEDNLLNYANLLYQDILKRKPNAPDSDKYAFKTAVFEQLNRVFKPEIVDLYKEELNKKFGPDINVLQKQQEEMKPLSEEQQNIIESSGAIGAAEGGYIDYLRDYNRYARGGRIHLSGGGGGPKLSRRGFLGFLAGAASLPFVGKLMKGKKTAQAVKIGTKVLPAVQGMPDWFNPLVARIMNEGTDISPKATRVQDITKVKKLEVPTPDGKGKDTIVMTEYPDGRIEISADVYGGSFDSPFDLVYEPPKSDINFTTGKAINEPGNFSVVEQRPKPDYNDPGNFEIDYEDVSVEDAISDLERLEKIGTGKRIPPQKVEKRTGARKFVEENPSEDIVNRYGDSEIEYDRMKDEGLFDETE